MSTYCYAFEEGKKEMKNVLGGKGANLAEMTRLGLPVPPGFTIAASASVYFMKHKKMPAGLREEILASMKKLEKKAGRRFGDARDPLLVSVRSGAAVSMPGMMDTVLNLGLNEKTVSGLAAQTGDERFAWDSFRRFIMMFSDIVYHVGRQKFEALLSDVKRSEQVQDDYAVSAEGMKQVALASLRLFAREVGSFPHDPYRQLMAAVEAVFVSWKNPRAITYRNLNKIPHDLGTAVNVQAMVFGNMGGDSGTGVAFTRNPSTGEKKLYGDFLPNAQGEDVVAGVRTPLPIREMKRLIPSAFARLVKACALLEKHYRDMMDIEFTVERGKLFMLQCRSGKRTAKAEVTIAVDMVKEGLISKAEALMRLNLQQVEHLLHGQLQREGDLVLLGRGLPASPGAASGMVVFDADEAQRQGEEGKKVILVRPQTVPDDIHGMIAAAGVLTSRGGMTSHAAVVARGMGKPCVCGAEELSIDLENKTVSANGQVVREGDWISIDGGTGEAYLGKLPVTEAKIPPKLRQLLLWADQTRKLGIRANADTPADARKAREHGAEGIGLCRTEHMFMGPERLPAMQEMILSESKGEREAALRKLEKMQVQDFIGIFKAMAGLPVTIRLLDPPLHEFLPAYEELLVEVTRLQERKNAKDLTMKRELLRRVESLKEANPMLGLRGCRLGLLFPEIYEMQVRAIFTAAARLAKRGEKVLPEVMIPLVGTVEEIRRTREQLEAEAKRVMEQEGRRIRYHFGTMIEIPRAALVADQIAEFAEFFSFGTNDLTQTTFGFSRDDAEGKFLYFYLDHKILPGNPFEVLDREGVGELMKIAIAKGKKVRKGLKVGICGEHGGDPDSIEFCHGLGMDYVSCSPYRTLVARLAAAQSALRAS